MEGAQAHRLIRGLASRQHGVVARRQLLEAGIGKGLVEHALVSDRLLTVIRGVYALGRRIDGYKGIWMAATLAAGPGGGLSGITAAAAWGFWKPTGLITVSRPGGRSWLASGAAPDYDRFRVVIKPGRLLPGELTWVGPIAICSVPGTLIQLAGTLTRHQLRRAFIEASRKGLLNHSNLAYCLSLGRSYKGMAYLSKLISMWHPESAKTKSYMEGDFFLLCAEHGIPAPQVNAWVGGKQVDCLWLDERVIVELDSRTFHDDQFAFDRDRVRQNAAVVGGFKVLRFTYRMITEGPAEVMAELASVLKVSETLCIRP